jgi:uncharacterized protein YbaR (Trm112 family)
MSQITISQQLLEMVRCPENRTRLRLADDILVGRLNAAAAAGTLRNVAGGPVTETMDGGLVREDCRILYPIVEGIPHLLVDEGIPLDVRTENP